MQGSIEKIAKILSLMPSKESQKTLEYIRSKNPILAEDIRKMMFTFDDIALVANRYMPLLHNRIDIKDLVLALKNISKELEEKLLSGISQSRKNSIIQERDFIINPKQKDVDSAKKRIAETVKRMIENGEISVNDDWIE